MAPPLDIWERTWYSGSKSVTHDDWNAMPVILLAFAIPVLYAALTVWPAMLLFGAIHSFLPVIPAFSFWQTFAIVMLTSLLFGGAKLNTN